MALEPRPRVYPVFIAFAGTYIVGSVAGTLVLAVWLLATQGSSQLLDPVAIEAFAWKPAMIIMSMGLLSSCAAAVALAAGALSPIPLRQRLRLLRGNIDALDVIAATLGALAIGEAFSTIMSLTGWTGGNIEHLQQVTRTMSGFELGLLLVAGAVGAGIGEELLFRGYMQTRLVRRWGPYWGVGLTAVLFGIVHFDVLHSSFALIMGVYFGWLAERRGTIIVGILAHVLNNTASFVMSAIVSGESPSTEMAIAVLAASVVLGTASIAFLARRQPPSRDPR